MPRIWRVSKRPLDAADVGIREEQTRKTAHVGMFFVFKVGEDDRQCPNVDNAWIVSP